ncbi:MAG TPA: fibronectin type III domain-containing protein, partial [Candidatus Thermoplasmatota archaeon]|nr:fibronectin type III domain-containing protein [Candidatus Thermoplasmatota archaeon]
VLLGTPGYPVAWVGDPDGVKRLGLLQPGTTLRIDADKFDAMAKGSYASPSSTNGHVDYEEAKRALGLSGYDFHIRVGPVFDAFDPASYGVEGMEDYHVGYVGHWNGAVEAPESKAERGALTLLSPFIKYNNATRLTLMGSGDAYRDDSTSLRSILVPLLGTQPAQTALQGGTGTPKHDFYMVNASAYQSNFNPLVRSGLSRALVLSDGAGNLGYTDGREVRATLGLANMSGLLTADLSWKEWVDTDGGTGSFDADDYGWIEVSADAGATWHRLTDNAVDRSKETFAGEQGDTWKLRTVTISSLNCAPCLNNPEVQVALHWVADGFDNKQPTGKGWIVDDVTLAPTTTTAFSKTFERPEFDLLIIGSNVDQNAFTAAEVKNAIRDYVNIYGGRIVVLGGQTNTNWLQPLFHVGIRTASAGVSTPDVTHPLLTTPNELDWQGYPYGNAAWDFTGGGDAGLFNMVVGAGAKEHILSASRQGAFSANGAEGVVMLTTYLPYQMPGDQSLRFLANALMYGRYHYLFMDYGPPVPTDTAVASVSRTAVMDKTRTPDESFIEMGIVLYVWQGGPTTSKATATAVPDRPWNLTAEQGVGQVYLNWSAPAWTGSAPIHQYVVYRNTTSGAQTPLVVLANSSNYTAGRLSFVDRNVTNGTTYFYNVTAVNSFGHSPSSMEVSATPYGKASAPASFTATGQAGLVALSWTEPTFHGGSIITGYRIYRNNTTGHMVPYATVGNQLSWQDTTIQPTVTYAYRVAAINGVGDGNLTDNRTASPLATPAAPTVTATPYYRQVVLTWAPP